MEGAADDDRAGASPAPLDLDRLGGVEQELAAVEHALGRLDAGTWGSCEACGAALDPATLAEDPTAGDCPAHR